MQIDYKGLANKIVAARKAQGITQEKLAELAGVSLSFIGKFESCNAESIGLHTLVKISMNLNISMDYLLSDTLKLKESDLDGEIRRLMAGASDNDKKLIKTMLQGINEYKKDIRNNI